MQNNRGAMNAKIAKYSLTRKRLLSHMKTNRLFKKPGSSALGLAPKKWIPEDDIKLT